MNRCVGLVLGAVVMLGGCTWQDTAYQMAQVPEHLRLADHIKVTHQPRWSLPLGTPVEVQVQPGVPVAWTQAAERGLARSFSLTQPADFQFTINWPEYPAADARHEGDAPEVMTAAGGQPGQAPPGIWAGSIHRIKSVKMPKLPAASQRGQLWVALTHRSGDYHESMAIQVNPKWWGQHWHQPRMIEATFAELAETLVAR